MVSNIRDIFRKKSNFHIQEMSYNTINVFPVGWQLLFYFSFRFLSVMLALLFKLTLFWILYLNFSSGRMVRTLVFRLWVGLPISLWSIRQRDNLLIISTWGDDPGMQKMSEKQMAAFPRTCAWNLVDETVWKSSLGLYWHEVTNNHNEEFEHFGFV